MGSASAGGPALLVIAGPCSVEDAGMLMETAAAVRAADVLQIGARNMQNVPLLQEAGLVPTLAAAAVAAGADGLLVEVHPRPADARSDGEQSLTVQAFGAMMQRLRPFAAAAGRTIAGGERYR